MGHVTDGGWCDCEPPADMPEAQRIGSQFAAQMLGAEICYGPTPADSLLGWLLAQDHPSAADIAEERARRRTAIDTDD